MGVVEKIIFCVFILRVVWCGQFDISLPERIEALRGSCVTINCRFDIDSIYNKDLTDSARGMWKKDSTIVFDSQNPDSSKFKGEITGKLVLKNCTTVFYDVNSDHNDIFLFRIEGNGGLKWDYRDKRILIRVIDSPPNPTLTMSIEQMEVQNQEVLEGNAVILSCSSISLCSSSPPTLTWSATNTFNEINRRQQQQSQTEIISDLNFTASYLQHGVTFTCTITYQLQNMNPTAQSNITLCVLYAPKNTSVSVFPSNSVLEGTSVTLTCRSYANPAVLNYTWFRENGGQLEQTGQNLTFSVTDRTLTGRYYCQAKNQHGTQNTSVLLDIQYAPKDTSVSLFPSESVLEGTSVTLTCRSDANPAVLNYTWYRENGGQLEQTGQNLTFSVTDRIHAGRYYCQATNQHGTQNTSVFLDIQYAPQISNSSRFGDIIVFSCEAHGNPSPKVEWHVSGCLVSNSTNTFISEEQLSITHLKSFITLPASFTDSLECVGTNSHGIASQQFQLGPLAQETAWFKINSMLVGFAVGALVMAILWLTIHTYKCLSRTRQEDKTGLIRNDGVVLHGNAKNAYDNPVVMPPAGDTTADEPESLHYSTIDFTNSKTKSRETRCVPSPNTDYAVVQYYGKNMK